MAGFPLGTPVLNLTGTVTNPTNTAYSDGLSTSFTMDRHGSALVTQLHGMRYTKSARGNLFLGTSGVAGAKLLAPGGTTAGFILYNPASSGVLLEVEQFKISGASTEALVVAGLGIEGSSQIPSGTLTGATITGLPLGGARGASQAKVYLAATVVAMVFIGGIGLSVGVVTGPAVNGIVDFDGTLVLAPGFALNFVSTITQGSDIAVCDVVWSEWPA